MAPSGVSYSLDFEAREAARFVGYRYLEFQELPGEEQNAIVAHYKMFNRVEAVRIDEAQKRADRKVRSRKAAGG